MEFLLELVFEIYLELMMLVVPEKRTTSKGFRALVTVIAILCLLGILALFVWGGVLVFERKNAWGWIPLVFATLLSLAQIIAGFVLSERKRRSDEEEP